MKLIIKITISLSLFFLFSCENSIKTNSENTKIKVLDSKIINIDTQVNREIELEKETISKVVKKHKKVKILDEPLPSVNIIINQKITSPLEIKLNSEGLWSAFEGEVGLVRLFNEKDEVLSMAILSSSDGDWMKVGPALFGCTLTFKTDHSKKGKLKFYSNPGPGSGEEAGDVATFEIQISF